MSKQFKILIAAGILLSLILLLMPVVFPLTGNGGSDWVAAIGRFHILVLHFPIALLLIVPVLELLGSIPALRFVKQTIPLLLTLAILFAFKACVLGYLLATGEGESGGLLEDHMWAGILTTVFMIVALIARLLYVHFNSKAACGSYIAALGISIITLTIGSHNGASLVHGEDYLYAKLPPSIKAALQLGSPEDQITPDSLVYDSLIRPIFEHQCFLCHSEAKQKGDFRMDDYERLLYGGESGMEGVVPGNLEDSEVHYRITLDPKNKGFMPPEGTDPLTDDQIALISWWIESGASPTLTIGELSESPVPEVLQNKLGELLHPVAEEKEPMNRDEFLRVSKLAKDKHGMDVILHSQNLEDGVYVVTRNAPVELPPDAILELLPLEPHITSINLWRRQLQNGTAEALANFQHLEELQLNETNVKKADLSVLVPLSNLSMLNLHGTTIGDESTDTLAQFKSLKKLLLSDSGITTNGLTTLRAQLPHCEVLAYIEPLETENDKKQTEQKAP